MDKEKDGVWRTIRGRRIFIAKGESLGSAMAKSGKFKREDIRTAKSGVSAEDRFKRSESKSLEKRRKEINKVQAKDTKYSNSVYTTNKQAEKNRVNENAPINKEGKTRVERNKERYSETDRRELRSEELQKKLADYRKKKGIKTSITSEEYNKKLDDAYNDLKAGKISQEEYSKTTDDIMDNYTTPRMNKEQVEKSNKKAIADYKAKKQSNNKIEASAKDIDNELRAKEDKYLSSYKPSEKQAKDIKTLHDKLKTQAEKEGYDTNKTNWRDDLQSNNKTDDAIYKPKNSYKSYHEKMQAHGDRDKWSGREYTNDEFMEHLTDSNWHRERRMIEEANLTNKQLTELKNQVTLSKWGVENFDGKQAQELIDKVKNNKQETIKNYVEKKQSNNKVATEINNNKAIRNENAQLKKYNEYNKNEEQYREKISREIAKELNASLKNASEIRLEKEAGNIRSYADGEVLEKGEKPYSNIYGGLERSTKSLEDWLKRLRKGK